MSIREPAVAGYFYNQSKSGLISDIEACFTGRNGPGDIPKPSGINAGKIIGLVVPHAGYIYSGSTAAYSYYRLAEDGIPDTVIYLAPNHRYYNPPIALSDEDGWRTPLGILEIDKDLVRAITAQLPDAKIMAQVHKPEHSIEVQLPFLQYISQTANKTPKIVPISIGSEAYATEDAGAEFALKAGLAIADAAGDSRTVLISSTDFTHYKSAEAAKKQDSAAINDILNLDAQGLLHSVKSLDISMCGALPTAIVIAAAKEMGAVSASLLKYSNSGDITGDYSEVVGYASIEILK